MAIGGVVINFLLKSREAVRELNLFTGEVEDTQDELKTLDRNLGDVQTELNQTGREARNINSDLDIAKRSFDSLGDEVEDTLRRIERDMPKMSGAVRREASDIDRATDGMRKDFGEAGRETGSEFISNIAEGIGSGQANLNDIVSGTLGGLTNLAATLTGPVGIAAGVAAAGIGLMWGKMRAEADKAKEQVQDLIGLLEDTEDQAEKVRQQKIFEEWLADAKLMPAQLSLMVDGMKTAGVKAEDFQAAIGGSETATKKVIDQLNIQIQKIEDSAEGQYGLTYEQQKTLDGLETAVGTLEDQNDALDVAKGVHEDINWLQGKSEEAQEGVTDEIRRSKTEAKKLKTELDKATQDRSMKVKIYAQGTGGAPASGGNNGGYPAGPRAYAYAAAPQTQAVVQPPTVVVTEEQIYRAVNQLLMRGDMRNGRTSRVAS